MSKILCDRCSHCNVNLSATSTSCHAYHLEMTRFKSGISKYYIEQRMTGEKKHCKQFKKL